MRLSTVVALVLLVAAAPAFADPKLVPSGPVKAYKGPEGELVVMLLVNNDSEMLVYLKNIGPEVDGKSLRYTYEDQGRGHKQVFVMKKRGSKSYRSVILSAGDNDWHFYHPSKPNIDFALTYSEKDSEKLKPDDVVAAYKP